jgi:hypothetical protein
MWGGGVSVYVGCDTHRVMGEQEYKDTGRAVFACQCRSSLEMANKGQM